MKKLFLVSLLLMLGALAFGQTNLPPCDPNNLPPNCTDYFGVANWANSPLPAGAITGFTVVSAGSGYVTPIITITDTTGTGATNPTLTLDPTGGIVVTAATGGGGTGYIAPQITVVDVGLNGTLAAPTCGAVGQTACGSGAIVTATIGAPLATGTGIRKFMDALPDLKGALATPDNTTFPGADYYVIGLTQYTTKMHSDLPPTTLRGYCQLNGPGGVCAPSYLGPVILAAKNRPVRVLFKNMLPNGAGGNLFIPVDSTYMGAGSPYTQNRATLHLHGGATPWISDGTPHQWTAPSGEVGPQKGDSTQNVPDMWFDATFALIPGCAAQPTCATPGATNEPGPGAMTFFWTNQQGGRLMFYHDHAYGLTRLNVYAGEAAGYLLGDPQEEDALQAATVPGTLGAAIGGTTAPDLAHLIPLVIQDKTFVPSPAQLAVEDPTWVPGGFGTIPGTANPGDLWFPHVYTPNQNPADVGGANAFGRWDYGPWTLPGNQTVLLAATPTVGDVTIPCTSSAFPNQAVNCPITPNPSGTPESFMDTPLVNGKAYPVLNVNPEAYRFQILSAGNDRSWNLQFYVADSSVTSPDGRTNTEVKMVPAIQPGTGSLTPLCSTLTPITNTSLFLGLATAVLDGTGNPINGTGLPAGCWPNFGAGTQTAGIPIQQTMWPADGRAGGAPDPTMAGPAFIQIGTEGGLLPAPVVIPSMPTGYEGNTRSVTITNVSVHGLWLGPAERADVIVDFSKFAGKTLILYNDAPTPAPAVDSRLDYFTGDGDQTPIGGAPNTLPGYGPNTRTIMQIVVAPGTPTNAFSLPALTKALPGLFAQTQPVPIVPEPTYPPASGGYSAIPTYSLITDASLTFFPIGSTTPVTYVDDRKTIQELFTLDYGRMNATLGVELPLTNFLTQTTIPLGYIDPPTEIINQGATQLWHITHNGVDTHFIHFHLFNVQVINRSAWDGTKRPPDPNELGWKDTVRMNPLEDILVALKPIQPLPPFPVRDSYRLMDVTMPAGSNCPDPATLNVNSPTPPPCSIFTNIDPVTNIATPTPNKSVPLGWEYVWHCHILGHEENDMMRAISFQVPPEAPSSLTVAPAATGLNLAWTDNSASETGFTLQRATTADFATPTNIQVGPSTPDANGQGIGWGGPISFNDTGAGAGPYFYRVQAFKPDATYWNPGPNITSAWSNTVSFGGAAASISPAVLNFGTWPVAQSSTPPLTATLSNTGTAQFTYTAAISGANSGDFMVTGDSCAGTAAVGANCVISLMFTPSVTGAESASLSIVTTPASPVLTVALTGTGGGANPLLTITANNATKRYGAAVPPLTFAYNPPNPAGITTPPTCTTTATAASPVGTYPITCAGAVGPFTFSYVAGTVSVTPAPLTIFGPAVTFGVGLIPAGFTPIPTAADYVGFVNGDTSASLTTLPTCTTTATNASPIGVYPITCSGAADPNYTISYAAGNLTLKPVLTVTGPSLTMPFGGPLPAPTLLTPTYSPANPTGLTTPATCSTTATVTSPVGSYPITCSGAVDANFFIVYVPGTLTVTPVPLAITAGSATVAYGSPVPTLTPTFATLLNGDTVASLGPGFACTTTYTQGGSVSGSPYPSTCSGAVNANYSPITYVAGSVTVTAVPLTITASSAIVPYGTAIPAITASYVGFVNGDTAANLTTAPTCSATVPAGNPVGTYPTNCGGAVDPNYTISYVAGTLQITAVPLTITANNAARAYGAANPAFTATYAGLVNGDTPASLTGTLSCNTTAVASSPVGTYPITCSGQTSTNYTISYVPGTLTVTAVPLTITANNASRAYGATNPAFTATYLGFVNGDTAASLTGTLSCSTTAIVSSPGGTYPITCSGQTSTNYTITYVPGTLTVTPVPLTLTANPASMVYGTALPAFSVTGTGFLNGDTVASLSGALVCVTTATPTSPVGTYPINCSGLTSPSYTITWAPGTLTVTRAALTVTANNASRIWGFANPAFSGTAVGLVGTDTLASIGVSCTSAATPTSAVGIYPITCTGTPVNYTVTYFPGTLAVTTAVQLTPAALVFAAQNVGTTSPFQTATLRNIGGSTMTFSAAITANFLRGGGGGGTCGTTLAAGATCTINVRFRPTTVGVITGTLTATSALAGSGVVALRGTGNGAAAAVSPTTTAAAPFNFGSVTRGQVGTPLTITVTNSGSTTLTFNAANGFTLGGASAGQFRLTTGGSCVNGGTLAALASCTFTVNFAPTAGTARNTKNATVTVRSNATNGNQFVYVRGTAQ